MHKEGNSRPMTSELVFWCIFVSPQLRLGVALVVAIQLWRSRKRNAKGGGEENGCPGVKLAKTSNKRQRKKTSKKCK